MAKIQLGLGFSGIKGRTQGSTYSTWRGGQTVRAFNKNVRRARSAQPRRRSGFGYLTRQWGQLTDVQRQLWRDYAVAHPVTDKFGNSVVLPGFNWFMKLNTILVPLKGTAGMISAPPVADLLITLASLSSADGVADGQIDLTVTQNGTGLAADNVEYQIAGPFQSQGRVEVFDRFARIEATAGDVLTKSFTGLQVLAWYWMRARYVNAQGQASNWLYVQHQAPDVP